MAKLHHVKRARRAIPEAGIEIGDQYWWFKRRINGKGVPRTCSKTKPRKSAYATSSPFLGALLDMEDGANSLLAIRAPAEEVAFWLEAHAELVEAMGESCSANAQSVEQNMKNGAGAVTAEVLRARAEHCTELAVAMREAAGELAAVGEVLSEDEGGEGESSGSVSIADVLGGLVFLPQ